MENRLILYKYVLALTLLLHLGFSFKPRNFEIFEKNCLRLLTTRQYSFLSAYFLEHSQIFSKQQRMVDLALNIVRNCPLINIKSDILTYLLKLESTKLNKRQVYFECGVLHYFQEDWRKSISFFLLSHRLMANYYLGECFFKLEEFKKAEYYFSVFIKKTEVDFPSIHFARFRLAEIAYIKKEHQKSYKLLLKSKYEGVDRNILLYQIYKKTGDTKLGKEVLTILKTKYKDDVKVKALLKEKIYE